MPQVHSQRLFPFRIVEVDPAYVGEEGSIAGYNEEYDYAFTIRPYPVGLTKHQLAALYWRPRNWGVEINPAMTITAEAGPYSATASIGARTWESAGEVDGNDEKSLLVLPWSLNSIDPWSHSLWDTADDGDEEYIASASISIFFWSVNFFSGLPGQFEPDIFADGLFPCVRANGLYYPFINVDLELGGNGECTFNEDDPETPVDASNSSSIGFNASTRFDYVAHQTAFWPEDPPSSATLTGRVHLPLDDEEVDFTFPIPAAMMSDSFIGPDGSAGTVTFGDFTHPITFRPWSYHSFGGTWDTDTGAPI